jgi:hypothetical protein
MKPVANAVRSAVRLLAFGALVGALLGCFAPVGIFGGDAPWWVYASYALFGLVLGILGSVAGGIIILAMRLVTRLVEGHPPPSAPDSEAGDGRPS